MMYKIETIVNGQEMQTAFLTHNALSAVVTTCSCIMAQFNWLAFVPRDCIRSSLTGNLGIISANYGGKHVIVYVEKIS